MIAPIDAVPCTEDQQAELLRYVRTGRLFELMEWVESGKPTLCPVYERPRNRSSLIHEAVDHGNHSMVRFLWERTWQRPWETDSLVASTIFKRNAASCEIAKFLIRQGIPLGRTSACSVFETHDDELIHLALAKGLSVRSPGGFADALSMTGHSKHLLRLFRELRGAYPDLETEGLLALREAVNDRKIRAVALITWAGVDPRRRIPDHPYDHPELPAEGTDDDDGPYLFSAFDEVQLDEKSRDLLKALKVEMSDDVWLHFFDQAGWLSPEQLPEVYHWIRKPDEVLLGHPAEASKLATMILKHLRGWTSDWLVERRQKLQLQACEYLAFLGIPFLVTENDHDVRQLRKSLGAVRNTEPLVRLLWVIHEKGDDAQRARLGQIIATPKMQSIVRQHDPFLLRDLGLGPKRLAKVTVTKRDRPWHADTYKPPRPFERPAKIKTTPEPPPRPIYSPPPPPAPTPTRPGYWNKWSHFHR